MKLLVLMETHPQQASTIVNFVIMEALSVYNIIIKRPTLNQTRAIVSTYSLIITFPTPHGDGSMRGDQTIARYCYVNPFRRNAVSESLNVKELNLRDDTD